MADLTGQVFGQYKIGARIGKGGMAAVYRARQESMDRDVAIKVMAAELAHNEEFVARFEREARVIARLQHPHILPVIDFGRSGEFVYLVMRLVEGGTLNDRLTDGSLTIEQVGSFLSQIGSALEYAHQRGVIHRDLKPNNVLLDESDNTYLTDFGIAKMIAGVTGNQALTSTGAVMGTPAYMAPEQWRSEPVDARTDIYALGIILYEMLIGGLPFQADTPFGMMYKHFDAPPPPLRLLNPNLPEAVERIVLRALAKNRIDRYSSAKQLADDFNRTTITLPPDLRVEQLPRATAQQIAQATAQVSAAPRTYTDGSLESLNLPPVPPAPSRVQPPAGGTYISPSGLQAPGTVVAHHRSTGQRIVGFGALAAVLIAGGLIAGLLLTRGGSDGGKNEGKKDNTQGPLATTEVTEPATSSAAIMVVTKNPTETPTAGATEAPPPTETPTPQPTLTPIPPTRAPLNLRATVQAQREARQLTQTAAHVPTMTPTPGRFQQTLQAQREARQLTQTAHALIPTVTPSATFDAPAATEAMSKTQTVVAIPTWNFEATAYSVSRTQTVVAMQPTLPPVPTRTPLPTSAPSALPPSATLIPTAANECGGMASRLTANSGARTTLYPNTPTRVRQAADMNSAVLRSIPAGQTFWLLAGPQCVNNVWFWQIQAVDATGLWTGYIGEGQAGAYWIEPFDSGPVQCPGAPSPRLTPGQKGRVTLYPAVPSRVRAEPNTTSAIQAQLQPGSPFTVLSGPVCDETTQIRWWQIEAPNAAGWMAEGQSGEYWLEPWQ